MFRVENDLSSHRKRYYSWYNQYDEVDEERLEDKTYVLPQKSPPRKVPSLSQKSSNRSGSKKSSSFGSSKASNLMMKEKARLAELVIEEEYT